MSRVCSASSPRRCPAARTEAPTRPVPRPAEPDPTSSTSRSLHHQPTWTRPRDADVRYALLWNMLVVLHHILQYYIISYYMIQHRRRNACGTSTAAPTNFMDTPNTISHHSSHHTIYPCSIAVRYHTYSDHTLHTYSNTILLSHVSCACASYLDGKATCTPSSILQMNEINFHHLFLPAVLGFAHSVSTTDDSDTKSPLWKS
mmetsp:Transcript_15097/g.41795  ORF Transcript_15097/g.41795 Transcript_15097/m.41795 type:complete len:202 (+) Transcript_15097:890-1495(+)